MDKRITNLKNLIIQENVWKIKKLNEKGFVDFDIEDKINFYDSMKDYYLTRLIYNGVTIILISTNYYTGKQYKFDTRLMDLEELDHHVTDELNTVIEKMNSLRDKYLMN
jgi:hypothetical protein